MKPLDPKAKTKNVLWYVVYSTYKIGWTLSDLKNLTSRKIIYYPTPVICGIMSLTVNSVNMAFLDNVVSEKASKSCV